jgi:hypothetical protein
LAGRHDGRKSGRLDTQQKNLIAWLFLRSALNPQSTSADNHEAISIFAMAT